MSEVRLPLEGVKVVELATFIAAPCTARFLADLGADVIKVEAPKGDPLRYTAVNEGRPLDQKENTSYDLENAGKRCISLNTKSEEGREALEKLIADGKLRAVAEARRCQACCLYSEHRDIARAVRTDERRIVAAVVK